MSKILKALFAGTILCISLTFLLFFIVFIQCYLRNIEFDYSYFAIYSLKRGFLMGGVGALLFYFNRPHKS